MIIKQSQTLFFSFFTLIVICLGITWFFTGEEATPHTKTPVGLVSQNAFSIDHIATESNVINGMIAEKFLENETLRNVQDKESLALKILVRPVSNDLVRLTWYSDLDRDSFGDPNLSTKNPTDEEILDGIFVRRNDDCDDQNLTANPAMLERCDKYDNDCDGFIDEPDAIGATLYFMDYDGDGFGNTAWSTSACEQPDNYVPNDTDCNDLDKNINPGQKERLGDNIDNDCDGQVDEGTLYRSPTPADH